MDVAQALKELRSVVANARSMPMSSSAVINRTEVLEMIDQLQVELQQALAGSDRVCSERDSVIAEARRDAERIVAEAHRERELLASETDVYTIAKRESEHLRSEAQLEATELRRETDEYVDQRLANLEIALTKTLEALSRGRDRLNGRSGLHNLDKSHDETPFPFSEVD